MVDAIQSAISNRPMSAYQVLIVAMCVAINILDGFDILAVAFAAPALAREWALPAEQIGLLLSSGLAGIGLGALVFSFIADATGRRPVILLSLSLMSAGMVAAAFTQSLHELALCRVITGLGIGGMTTTAGTLAIEYSSQKRRTLSVALVVIGYPVGATFGGFIAVWLLDAFGWRSVFLAGGLASTLLLPLLVWKLPESIAFLADRQPRDVLRRLNRYVARLGLPPVDSLPPRAAKTGGRALKELLRPPFGARTARLSLAYAGFMFSFYFIINWATKLVTELGLPDRIGVTTSILINLGGIVGGLAVGAISAHIPLQRLVLAVVGAMALAIAPFGALPASVSYLYPAALILGFIMWAGSATVYSVIALAYPPRIRASGMGLVITAGRVGSVAGPYCAGLLLGAGVDAALVTTALATPAVAAAFLLSAAPSVDPS